MISDETIRDERLNELYEFLIRQKYPSELIKNGIERAKVIPIAELRKTRETQSTDDNIIPFVVTHNPRNTDIFQFAKSNLPVIAQDRHLKELINEKTLIRSKRQPPNLKRLLTKAKFDFNHKKSECTVSKCNDNRCGTCVSILSGHDITLKSGTTLYTNADMNCKSTNLIYCIKCPGCEEIYIGQTRNSVSERMRVHRQQIRDPSVRQIPLSEHLEICGGGRFFVFPFYKMQCSSDILRDIKEKSFISKFNPILNRQ